VNLFTSFDLMKAVLKLHELHKFVQNLMFLLSCMIWDPSFFLLLVRFIDLVQKLKRFLFLYPSIIL